MALVKLQPFNLDSTKDFTFNNVTATANLLASNANLGNAATANFFVGNGSLLTGISTSSSIIANGNSNVSIATANGNVTIAAVGNTTLTVTGTGVNVAGYVNATGNINGANLTGTHYGAATGLTSIPGANVTGTVPLATSATNAAALLTNLASTGTYYIPFISATANGNYAHASNANFSANLANGYITATGFVGALSGAATSATTAGTVTTNAQPNITSVGTLTSLGVNGTVTAVAFTANTGVFTGNGSGLSAIAGANVTGTVANATYAVSAGTVTTAAQPNITSVGTLSSLAVTANANVGNLGTTALVATGTGSFGGNVNMNSFYINNLGTPSAATDAATKSYVDGLASTGLYYHAAVNAATTTTLATTTGGTVTYNNGTAGVNANLVTTGSYTTVDGVNIASVGARILVKNEANAAWNGVYTYANATTIVRSTDTDSYGPGTGDLSENDYFFVSAGSVNIGTAYVCNTAGTIVFGTTNITFSLFSTSQVYSAGTGLTLTNTTFSVNASQTQITTVGTLTSLGVNGTVTAVAFTANTGVFTGNGSGLSAITGANVTGTVANATYAVSAGSATSATTAGTVTTNAQPNITSVGLLTGLTIGNATANSVFGNGTITLNSGLITGNGAGLSQLAGANVTGTVANATYAVSAGSATNAAALLTTLTSTGTAYIPFISATATSNYAHLSNANFSANLANGYITATGFVGTLSGAATSATTAGTVTTNAQPNITSVGTLTSLGVSGTVTASTFTSNVATGTAPFTVTSNTVVTNLNADLLDGYNTAAANTASTIALRDANGNVSANFFIGNGSQLTGIATGIASTIANGNSNVNIATANGNVTIAAVGNTTLTITGTGVNVSGTLNTGTGNANVGNLGTTRVLASANITAPQLISNIATGTAPFVVTSNTVVTNLNADLLDGYTVASANTASTIALRDANGNVSANFFIGNGSQLTGISASTATTAGTVTTNAQPNITSTGTLSSVTVSGTTNLGPVGNITITGGSNAQVLTTNGSGGLSWTSATQTIVTVNAFTGNGVQTAFTLSVTPVSEDYVTATVGGVTQPHSAFTLSGNVVTMSSAPPNATIVEFVSTTGGSVGPILSSISNGNSNVNIATANGNVTISAVGNTTLTITGTGANIAGSLSATGGLTSRIVSVTDATSITMNGDTTDVATQTNTQVAGTLTINAVTGTLVNGQKIMLRLQSANVQTFSWNGVFAGSTDSPLPTVSSGSNKYDYLGFIYNTTATKWQLLAKNFGF